MKIYAFTAPFDETQYIKITKDDNDNLKNISITDSCLSTYHDPSFELIKDQILDVFHNTKKVEKFNISKHLPGLRVFTREVYYALSETRAGETHTYATLANIINNSNAVRAVGTAMKNNPFPLLIPCHRVIKSDGTLGNYNSGGTMVKKKILDYESKFK